VPAAARADPGLTTVRQSHVEKGRQAAALLIGAPLGAESDEVANIVLPVELVVRGSTGRPRHGNC